MFSGGSMKLNETIRFGGEGNGTPLQCSCLGNPMDRGAWWASVHGVAKCWTWLKRLSIQPIKLPKDGDYHQICLASWNFRSHPAHLWKGWGDLQVSGLPMASDLISHAYLVKPPWNPKGQVLRASRGVMLSENISHLSTHLAVCSSSIWLFLSYMYFIINWLSSK